MSSEHRYSEEEIAEIFRTASENQAAGGNAGSANAGLTLSELKQIGSETGISADQIAHAAAQLRLEKKAEPESILLGLPVSASHQVEFEGPLSDDDWNRLVAQMRIAFRASGKTHNEGEFRSWRNGKLQISVEPTSNGHRFQMSTYKTSAKAALLGTAAGGIVATTLLVAAMLFGQMDVRDMVILGLFAGVSLGAFSINFLTLRRWAALRKSQMVSLAERAAQFAERYKSPPALEAKASGLIDMEEEDLVEEKESTHVDLRTKA